MMITKHFYFTTHHILFYIAPDMAGTKTGEEANFLKKNARGKSCPSSSSCLPPQTACTGRSPSSTGGTASSARATCRTCQPQLFGETTSSTVDLLGCSMDPSSQQLTVLCTMVKPMPVEVSCSTSDELLYST